MHPTHFMPRDHEHEVKIAEKKWLSHVDTFQREYRPERLRLLTSEAGERICRACSGENWAAAPIRGEPRSNPYGEPKNLPIFTCGEVRATQVYKSFLFPSSWEKKALEASNA